jgi:hypothetical protein
MYSGGTGGGLGDLGAPAPKNVRKAPTITKAAAKPAPLVRAVVTAPPAPAAAKKKNIFQRTVAAVAKAVPTIVRAADAVGVPGAGLVRTVAAAGAGVVGRRPAAPPPPVEVLETPTFTPAGRGARGGVPAWRGSGMQPAARDATARPPMRPADARPSAPTRRGELAVGRTATPPATPPRGTKPRNARPEPVTAEPGGRGAVNRDPIMLPGLTVTARNPVLKGEGKETARRAVAAEEAARTLERQAAVTGDSTQARLAGQARGIADRLRKAVDDIRNEVEHRADQATAAIGSGSAAVEAARQVFDPAPAPAPSPLSNPVVIAAGLGVVALVAMNSGGRERR